MTESEQVSETLLPSVSQADSPAPNQRYVNVYVFLYNFVLFLFWF